MMVAYGALAAPALATPPATSNSPSVSGLLQQNATLTEVSAPWTGGDATSVQWFDCPDTTRSGCTPIGSAPTTPGSQYTLGQNDVGKYIMVTETATANDGSGDTAQASSSPLGVVMASSTTVLTASPSSGLVTNQTATLTAVVSSGAAGQQPMGTVTFMNDGDPISSQCSNVPVSSAGLSVATAQCQASFPASSPQLTASFVQGGGLVADSTTTPASLSVGQDTSTTSLDASSTVDVGQSTTYTASVAGNPPGPVLPTGTITFADRGAPISACTNEPVINGGATCTVTYTTPGSHAITAQYGGDTNFTGSASPRQAVSAVAAPIPPSPATPIPASPATPTATATPVLGTITATMQWTFSYTPSYTRVLALVLNGAKNAKVILRCAGRGCPFSHRASSLGAGRRCGKHSKGRCPAAATLNLTSIFANRQLSVGTRIAVAITRPSWIGKYYLFTIRRGQSPRIHIGCLAPGQTRPGGTC